MIRIYENNLLWSQRLKMSLIASSFDVQVLSSELSDFEIENSHGFRGVDVAIVNLSATHYNPSLLISSLKSAGVKIIAHAGHKEGSLLELGERSGADLVVSNREITTKVVELVRKLVENTNKS